MRERPILFSAPMVRAILEGRKTQTRRVITPQPRERQGLDCRRLLYLKKDGTPQLDESIDPVPVGQMAICLNPYGVEGDRLWVRETWTSGYRDGCFGTICAADSAFFQGKRQHEKGPHFHAKEIGEHIKWRPSIFMPRWASRLTLEITDVRVQRIQEISEEDAESEGVVLLKTNCDGECGGTPCLVTRQPFIQLWDSINAKRGFGWDVNPWVWAMTFKATA